MSASKARVVLSIIGISCHLRVLEHSTCSTERLLYLADPILCLELKAVKML